MACFQMGTNDNCLSQLIPVYDRRRVSGTEYWADEFMFGGTPVFQEVAKVYWKCTSWIIQGTKRRLGSELRNYCSVRRRRHFGLEPE